jgi:hypothetical protein
MKSAYEKKVAMEEQLHKKYLEDKADKKREREWMNLSDEEAHRQIEEMNSLNFTFRARGEK